jgi:hypothetical protein
VNLGQANIRADLSGERGEDFSFLPCLPENPENVRWCRPARKIHKET